MGEKRLLMMIKIQRVDLDGPVLHSRNRGVSRVLVIVLCSSIKNRALPSDKNLKLVPSGCAGAPWEPARRFNRIPTGYLPLRGRRGPTVEWAPTMVIADCTSFYPTLPILYRCYR
ncbi:hypothetical protein PM082_016785 [Marasmius tenuissimus]|nr:hypothetical protein PM082_016785 [Marasmius tenuissimus]